MKASILFSVLLIVLFTIKLSAQEFHNNILLAKLKYNDAFSFSVVADKANNKKIITNVNKIDLLNTEFKCKNLSYLFTDIPKEGLEKLYWFSGKRNFRLVK